MSVYWTVASFVENYFTRLYMFDIRNQLIFTLEQKNIATRHPIGGYI